MRVSGSFLADSGEAGLRAVVRPIRSAGLVGDGFPRRALEMVSVWCGAGSYGCGALRGVSQMTDCGCRFLCGRGWEGEGQRCMGRSGLVRCLMHRGTNGMQGDGDRS